eukprot:NODE_11297_length_1296_cov_2.808383.p2 GENE.NODE_11297_length_1296_cov_2.808383~~NODE_11297_length_1296_cov_2.808383.p2  ORF type:complete len:224 (-),score=36.53 NODE_11297_length_1296_cov_2.808383:171-842(-)
MTHFATRYKKVLKLKETCRTQAPLVYKETRELTTHIIDACTPADRVDISAISGETAFMRRIWLWGFDEGMVQTQFCPQCDGMLWILCGGEIEWFMISSSKLLAAKLTGGACTTEAALSTAFQNVTLEQLNTMRNQGIKVYTVRLNTSPSVLFVPQGWLLAKVVKAGPHVYGMRKSFFVATEEGINNSRACGTILAGASGADHHNEIVTILNDAAAGANKGSTV